MNKVLCQILIAMISFIFCFSGDLYLLKYKFDTKSVKNSIEYLSSDKFKGRLGGTIENGEISIYIKNKFQQYGLKPFSNNYFSSFSTIYPHKIEGTPYLNVTDKSGFLIKEFSYGADFKEDLLNFKNNTVSFKKEDNIGFYGDFIQIKRDNDFFLFYVPQSDKLNFRSSFVSNSPHSMYVILTKNTFNELRNYLNKDFTVNCYIPFESKKTLLNNVCAYIKGSDSSLPPLMLSAHFDHVGSDLKGNIYNGALDNASGTAFMLESAKYIKSLGKPDRDIIFIAFNAEEFGCLGSRAFVENFYDKIKDGRLLNFDMIGSNNPVPIYLMGGKNDSKDSPFINEISYICKDNSIKFSYLFEDASDHEYFREKNIEALTLSDSDVSRIHTPQDKKDFISSTSIERCFKIMNSEVLQYAFKNNLFVIYNTQIFWSSLTLLIFVSIYAKIKK